MTSGSNYSGMCNPRSKVHVILFDSDRIARNLNAIGHRALQRKPVMAPFQAPSGGEWVDEWMNGRMGAGGPPLGITTARDGHDFERRRCPCPRTSGILAPSR